MEKNGAMASVEVVIANKIVGIEREASNIEAVIEEHPESLAARIQPLTEKLEEQAYATDALAIDRFSKLPPLQSNDRLPEMKVESNISRYLLLLFSNDRLYLKVVKARAEDLQKQIRVKRANMRRKVYMNNMREMFKLYYMKIEREKEDLISR